MNAKKQKCIVCRLKLKINQKLKKDINTDVSNEIDATCLDVTYLINLYQEVAKANLLLIQILDQLLIDRAQMAEIKKNIDKNYW
jgi:hypothetical protein